MKCKVNIHLSFDVDWYHTDGGIIEDESVYESEIIRHLYQFVKDDPFDFISQECLSNKDVSFVAVSKG